MQQAHDFLEESNLLAGLLGDLPEGDWARPTQFKGWSINDVIVHLHFWNKAADLSLQDQDAFQTLMADVFPKLGQIGFRAVENQAIPERGPALFDLWSQQFREMSTRWAQVDPKARLKWAGPDMSARSSITARQMETWAHGHEVFDLLGQHRPEADRIRNIVVLGVNTFGWSHKVQGLDVPDVVPHLRLTAPSGALWEFGDPHSPDTIRGAAVAFAQVVTQTRHVQDTDLQVDGPVATTWMNTAQCFAGQKEAPPKPGTRFVTG